MAAALPTNCVKDENGTFIAASQRPDGTWRKARRVKEGYVPQDEVPLYESKGKQWAKGKPGHVVGMPAPSRGAGGGVYQVPGFTSARPTIPGLTVSSADEAAKSKKKKKKKGDGVPEVTEALQGVRLKWPDADKPPKVTGATPKAPEVAAAAPTEPAKRLKNLKKRLREVEQLEERITSGELKSPDKDQLEKVKRKDDLKEQIADLESELGL